MTDPWEAQREALGAFIREQRKRANLSLRQLAELTSLSNPYLSQVERGLHQPSVRVLKALSGALNVSAETLMTQAGLIDAIAGEATGATDTEEPNVPGTEDAIAADPRLGDEQKAALIAVYRSMLASAPPLTTRGLAAATTCRSSSAVVTGPTPPGTGLSAPATSATAGIDVPGQPAVRRGVGPHVHHDRTPAHKARPHQPRPPRRHHEHLGRRRHGRQIHGPRVAHGHGRVPGEQQLRHRLAHHRRTSHHHRTPPAQRHLDSNRAAPAPPRRWPARRPAARSSAAPARPGSPRPRPWPDR